MTDFCFSAFMGYDILKKLGGDTMATILMIDDERPILELVKNGLQKDGHLVTVYTSAAQVPLDKLNRYDLIILDIMMPDIDGFSYCDKIRSLVDCPILFLTAKTMENDITFGLGLGADDYLTKPFSLIEMVARINAVLRRCNGNVQSEEIVIGALSLNEANHEVKVNGQIVDLTLKEYELLLLMLKRQGRVFSRDQLLDRIWGTEYDGESRTVDVHIRTLRQKLG